MWVNCILRPTGLISPHSLLLLWLDVEEEVLVWYSDKRRRSRLHFVVGSSLFGNFDSGKGER